MMRTEKLYYADSHLAEFRAKVLRCEALKDGRYAVVLDQTAFFPEGGGQAADTGTIGEAEVLDVREKDGEILHFLSSPLEQNVVVDCRLDWEKRIRRMQNHSGEHVLSGLVHGTYGYDNVGFHMGEECMTIDFSGELTWEQMLELEKRANETVRANIPVRTYFPSAEELAVLDYRSKLELTEDVRIVEIEGIDRCACCAPHVSETGEIGIIKVLSCERHRGGTRVEVVCGMDALDNFNARQQSVTEISNLLSAKRGEVSRAVEHLLAERDELKYTLTAAERTITRLLADTVHETEGNLLFINYSAIALKAAAASFAADVTDHQEIMKNDVAQRELVNLLVPKCNGMAAVFAGDDASGYRYIIGSRTCDLRTKAREINTALSGRGGGKPEMIMGSCSAKADRIREFFSSSN